MVREKGRSLLHGVDGGMEQTIGADWGDFARTANDAFLLAFPSLFSIINPIGGALIFYGVTKDFATADRLRGELTAAGWSMLDGKDGYRLEPLKKA